MKSLVEQTKALMEALELHYDWDEEDKVFRLDFNTENTKVFVTIECLEDKGILINHGWLPINLPKEKKTAILYAINKIHDQWSTQAHLYLDEDDNNLIARCMLPLPEMGLDGVGEDGFARFVASTCNILDDHFKTIMEVAYGQDMSLAN